METANSSQTRLLYNPQLQSAEMIEKLFVVRQKQFSLLLGNILKEKENSIPQHYLIIGQRGMGKTTILKRMEVELHKEEYRKQFIPLLYREEQYNIKDLAEFWLNTLDALADSLQTEKYPPEMLANLDKTIQELSRKIPEIVSKEAFDFLMSTCREIHRRPVLLIDNIDIVFSGLDSNSKNKQEQWALRKLLSENGAPIIIGGGITTTDNVAKYEMPFYDFFKIQYLTKLNYEEFMRLLNNLAAVTNSDVNVFATIQQNTSRQKALLELTGGSPRVTVMLFDQISKGFSTDINDDLNILADAITPLYKAKFEELPQQQRIIIDAIALNWDAISLRKLALATRMKNNQLSPQLKRLIDNGWIENTPAYKDKGNSYFISERFFNIYYLIRNSSRRHKDKIYCLSKFLECFYGKEELERISSAMLKQDICTSEQMRLHLAISNVKILNLSKRKKIQQKTVEAFSKSEILRKEFDFPEQDFLLIQSKSLLKLLTEAYSLIKMQRYEEAIHCCDKAIELNPKHGGSWKFKGYCLQEMQRDEEAIQCYDKAIELNPKDADSWFFKGYSLEEMQRYEEAIHCYDKAIELNPKDADSWKFKGNCLQEMQRYEEAIHCYDKVIELNPKDAGIWKFKGDCLRKMQRYEEAIHCYDKTIELNPKDADTWKFKGDCLRKMQRYEEAIHCYDKAIELNPKDADSWFFKAYRLIEMQRYEEAIHCYDKAIELNPKDAYSWFFKGYSLEEMQRYEEAIHCFDKAIEVNPKDADSWRFKGDCLQEMQRYEEAIHCFDKAIEVNPKDADSWRFKGDCLQEMQHYEEAIHCYDKAIELNPRNTTFWNNKAYSLIDLQRYKDTIDCCNKAIELDENNDSAMSNKGYALIELKKYEDATIVYEQSLSVNPQNLFATFSLIFLYRDKLGKIEKAMELFNSIDEQKINENKNSACRYYLNKASFELYNQNKGLAKNSLLQAFEILEKDNKLVTLANEHWGMKFGSIAVKLGYASWLLDVFEEKGYDVVLSPYYTAIQALRIEQKESFGNAEIYLKNRAVEIGEPARLIIEKIKKYIN